MSFAEKTIKPASASHKSSENTLFRKPGERFFDRLQNTLFGSKQQTPFFKPAVQAKLQTANNVQRKEGDDTKDQKPQQPPVTRQVHQYSTPVSFKDLDYLLQPQVPVNQPDATRVAPPLVYDLKPEGKLKSVHSSYAGKAVQFLGGEPYKYIIHYRGIDSIVKIETIYSLRNMPSSNIWSIPTNQPKVVQFVKEDQEGKEISHTGEIPLKNFGSTLYVGPWNPKYEKKDGKDEKGLPLEGRDRYDYPAINSLDAAGKKHDKAYEHLQAAGPTSAVGDLKTINADKQLVKDAAQVVAMYKLGKTDPVNHQKVSQEIYEAAVKVVKLFTTIVAEKEARIAAGKAKQKAGSFWDENIVQPWENNVVKPITDFQENGWRMFVQ